MEYPEVGEALEEGTPTPVLYFTVPGAVSLICQLIGESLEVQIDTPDDLKKFLEAPNLFTDSKSVQNKVSHLHQLLVLLDSGGLEI